MFIIRRAYVNECLQELTKNKFVNRDFTGTSDPNNAPPEMQFTDSSGTQFTVKGVMSHRDETEVMVCVMSHRDGVMYKQ